MFFGNMTPAMRDQIILKELLDLITKKSNQFIVVIKNGSHFPYEKNLDQKKYDLKRNESLETIYKLSLKENTINFLEKLISSNNLNTEVLYFSDHGQSFKSKRLSHCNSLNPDIEEWEIPLLYYKGNKNKKIDINNNLKFYDFVLSMMGFKNSKRALRYIQFKFRQNKSS